MDKVDLRTLSGRVGDSNLVTSYLARHTGMKSSVRMNDAGLIGWWWMGARRFDRVGSCLLVLLVVLSFTI